MNLVVAQSESALVQFDLKVGLEPDNATEIDFFDRLIGQPLHIVADKQHLLSSRFECRTERNSKNSQPNIFNVSS